MRWKGSALATHTRAMADNDDLSWSLACGVENVLTSFGDSLDLNSIVETMQYVLYNEDQPQKDGLISGGGAVVVFSTHAIKTDHNNNDDDEVSRQEQE